MGREKAVEQATELEFLKWFFRTADFGPGSMDVWDYMYQEFTENTGKSLPAGYVEDDEEEES